MWNLFQSTSGFNAWPLTPFWLVRSGFRLFCKHWKLLGHLPLTFQSLFTPHAVPHTWIWLQELSDCQLDRSCLNLPFTEHLVS